LWANGWIDEDATWYGSRPRPRPHCIRRGPSSAQNRHSSPHLFGPCLLWPRSPISATAELLFRICQRRWSPYKQYLIQEVEKVQKRATKLVHGCKHLPYTEKLKYLKLPTLKYRRHRGDMIET